jgi:monofunctional biosynthetic peptidoglycan transglycosylase
VKRKLVILGVGAGTIALVSIGIFMLWWWSPGEDLGAWRSGRPPHTWASWKRQEAVWRGEGLQRQVEHEYVPLDKISIELQLAVLVNEDIDFFGHGAVDPGAVREAIEEWWEGSRLRGASTISQQLARTLFLSQERSMARKLSEARLAWWLERRLGKRRIFELYLNVVEFGPGLLGSQAASCHYYEVAADSLRPTEAAGLAATLPSPSRDNPRTGTERWLFRRETILRRMTGAGWLRDKLEALNEAETTRPR